MIQTIYLDTSVIGGCFDPEFAPWSNGLVQDFQTGNFRPVLSEVVAQEIETAPALVRDKFTEIVQFNPNLLIVTQEVLKLVNLYQQRQVLMPKNRNDMLHIALATVAQVNLVVSWNFKHFLRLDRVRAFNAVNLEQGYRLLEIHSPREVTHYGND
jgi:predicted nucleic acid-binding protein